MCIYLTSPPPSPLLLAAAGGGRGGGNGDFALALLTGGAAHIKMNIFGRVRTDKVTTFIRQMASCIHNKRKLSCKSDPAAASFIFPLSHFAEE